MVRGCVGTMGVKLCSPGHSEPCGHPADKLPLQTQFKICKHQEMEGKH